MPTISALERQNELISIRNLITNVTRYLVAISLLAFLNCVFVGYQFLDLWLSREFAEHSWRLLLVLSISVIFTYPHAVALNALSGLGLPEIVNSIAWIDAIGIVVGFFVVITFGGIFEISLAYCVARSVVFLYFIPKNICQQISLTPWSYFLSVYARPALIALPTAALFIISKLYFSLEGWVSLVGICAGVSTFFCMSAWYFVLEKADRRFLLGEFNSVAGAMKSVFCYTRTVASRAEPSGEDSN